MAFFGQQSGIIAQPFVFSESYRPGQLTGRSAEMSQLLKCLEPAVQGGRPGHAWLLGSSGSGKTSIVGAVLEQMKVESLRVNCWEDPSAYLVLDRVCRELRILRAEQQSTSYKLQRLKDHLGKRPFVLVLDELDMMPPRERSAILYHLHDFGKLGLVVVSYSRSAYTELDGRVRSRLNPTIILVKPYEPEQLADILRARAEHGLMPESWSREQINRIAALAERDARLAIQTLGKAAQAAERGQAREIAATHIDAAWAGYSDLKAAYRLKDLNIHSRMLYELVQKAQEIPSTDLRRAYLERCKQSKLTPIAERTFLVYLKRLIGQRLIEEEWVIHGGRTRMIRARGGA